jgi:hypothetical protein
MAFYDGVRRHERFGLLFFPAVSSRARLAACHAELGTFAAGRVLVEEGRQIAEAVHHPGSLMFAAWGDGLLALRQGDLRRALLLLERAMGLCHEADQSSFFSRLAALLGAAYSLSGRVADAVPLLIQAMEHKPCHDLVYILGVFSRL